MSTIRITNAPIADASTDATTEELRQIREALGLLSPDARNALELRDNGLYAGNFIKGEAAATLSGHIVLRVDEAGKLAAASADQLAHRFSIVGVSTGAAVMGAVMTAQHTDVLEHSGWSWSANNPVFLGLNGALTQTAPPSAVFLLTVGMAVSPTRLAICIQPPIVLS